MPPPSKRPEPPAVREGRPDGSETVTCREVHFSGRVQGVGFRYATLQLAKGFEVTGSVENLADGRVRLVAEGDERETGAFIAAVEHGLERHIRRVERGEVANGPRRHAGFTIR